MMLGKKEDINFNSDVPPCPAASYLAVIFGVFDKGIQDVKNFKTGEIRQCEVISIGYELNKKIPSGEFKGQNYIFYKDYNVKNYKIVISGGQVSNIYKVIRAIFGSTKDADINDGYFNTDELIGQYCNVEIDGTLDDKGNQKNAYIRSVTKKTEGTPLFDMTMKNHVPSFMKKEDNKDF